MSDTQTAASPLKQITRYYHGPFRDDLAKLLGNSRTQHFGQGWQRRCAGLERVLPANRPRFLMCLYFTVLVDQAMCAHYPQDYQEFESLTRYPKFCLGVNRQPQNPRTILTAPVEQRLVSADNLKRWAEPAMELFVSEVVEFFRDYMPQITSVEFFEMLLDDPDIQVPSDADLADESIAASTANLAYTSLQSAVEKAELTTIINP